MTIKKRQQEAKRKKLKKSKGLLLSIQMKVPREEKRSDKKSVTKREPLTVKENQTAHSNPEERRGRQSRKRRRVDEDCSGQTEEEVLELVYQLGAVHSNLSLLEDTNKSMHQSREELRASLQNSLGTLSF